MIRLILSEDGQIVLFAEGDSDFRQDSHGGDLRLFLDARPGGAPMSYVLGPIDRAKDIIEFIKGWAESAHFELTFDEHLSPLVQSIEGETGLINLILGGRAPETSESDLPSLPSRSLLPHQIQAVKHAISTCYPADFSVPGSGKTTVALAAFAYWRAKGIVTHLMIIGPASCFDPWEEEFRACFARNAKSIRLIGTAEDRRRAAANLSKIDMLLSTYQMAYREESTLRDVLSRNKCMLILDESHNVKRYREGVWAETLLRLAPSASRRMILTGTPAPHSIHDFWTQFTFLWPSGGILGSRAEFERDFVREDVAALRNRITHFYHRTTKRELGLPNPVVETTIIEAKRWPPRQKKVIRLLEIRTMRAILDLPLKPKDVLTIRNWRRSRIIRLLQASSNPALLAGRDPNMEDSDQVSEDAIELRELVENYNRLERSAKMEWTIRKTGELVKSGRKVVIWTSFVGNIKLLEILLKDYGVVTAYGEIKPFDDESQQANEESREKNIRKFKLGPQTMVLVANPAACAESISLHHACHDAIYLDRTFNCGHFLQSMDRIHRVGLPAGSTTRYHIPLMNCAIDRIVDRRLMERQTVLFNLLMDQALPIGGWSEDALVEDEEDLEQIISELRLELERENSAK